MIEESQPAQQPRETGPDPGPVLGHATTRPRALHVVVPHEAWRRARSAALDSGLTFKDYMALLMLSARPIGSTDNAPAAIAAVDGESKGSAGLPQVKDLDPEP